MSAQLLLLWFWVSLFSHLNFVLNALKWWRFMFCVALNVRIVQVVCYIEQLWLGLVIWLGMPLMLAFPCYIAWDRERFTASFELFIYPRDRYVVRYFQRVLFLHALERRLLQLTRIFSVFKRLILLLCINKWFVLVQSSTERKSI